MAIVVLVDFANSLVDILVLILVEDHTRTAQRFTLTSTLHGLYSTSTVRVYTTIPPIPKICTVRHTGTGNTYSTPGPMIIIIQVSAKPLTDAHYKIAECHTVFQAVPVM